MPIFVAVFPRILVARHKYRLPNTYFNVYFYMPVTSYNKNYCSQLKRLYLRSKYLTEMHQSLIYLAPFGTEPQIIFNCNQ